MILAPIAGGFLAAFSWRWAFAPFLLCVPLALAAVLWMPETSRPSGDTLRQYFTQTFFAMREPRLGRQLAHLEARVAEVVNKGGRDLSAGAGEQFFRLLGGYRGVSEAALAYAGVAQSINWSQWREEWFS